MSATKNRPPDQRFSTKAGIDEMKTIIMALALTSLATGPVLAAESPQARDARMAWWREARFGMFVHWGLYSGLAGTWQGKKVSDSGGMEWIQNRVKADTWEYAHEAVPYFRPSADFAKQWAKVAKQAGCKYVVFTTKHHDGFSLHDSSVTTYDAKDVVGRDLCKEITEAFKAEGLKLGYYHSVIDWHHPQYDYAAAKDLPYPLKELPSPNGPRNHELYVDYLHHQTEELMSNYGPVDIIWWDFSKKGAEGAFWRADELMALVRTHQPRIISNNRLYHITSPAESSHGDRLKAWRPEQGDFTTPEQHIPATGVPGVDWEVCMTMNSTWGYSEHDHAWKSDEVLIRNLIDIVSKGGNYLLNIGPKGDGSIPEASLKSMAAIGRWMDVNGESIYGSSASPFEKPAWGRYTRRAGMLYAHVFQWPTDGKLRIAAEGIEASRAHLLADREQTLQIEATSEGLLIHLPEKAPDLIASVVAIECNADGP
jgi:alpha-L-fucosidase